MSLFMDRSAWPIQPALVAPTSIYMVIGLRSADAGDLT
jgi:hypothetical protein